MKATDHDYILGFRQGNSDSCHNQQQDVSEARRHGRTLQVVVSTM